MAEGAEQKVEVIGFERPEGEAKTLFVGGIPRRMSREEKWAFLHEAFSQYGLIHNINLPLSPYTNEPNSEAGEPTATDVPPGAMETEYGFVRFYSSLAAKTAQLKTHRALRLGGQVLKVQPSRARDKSSVPSSPPSLLHITKCWELCNHYLGFNSWNVRIVSMDNIENGEGRGSVCVQCRVEVTVKGCEGGSRGMGEGRGEEGEGGTGGGLSARKAARKKAYNRACEDAFSHILLLVAPGRRAAAMIVRRPEDHMRQLMGDLVSTCPPVNVLPWQPDCPDEEETVT